MGLALYFIGSMSEIYPTSSTVPPQWTSEPNQPGVVQYNGLVYVKTERHTGGTGKPNEEEVDGIRTWRLNTSNSPSSPYRYIWKHLHSVISYYTAFIPELDEDCYSFIQSYFFLYPNQFTASMDQNKGRTVPETLRYLDFLHTDGSSNSYVAASGLFEFWEDYLPNIPPGFPYGSSGYPSGNPDYPDIPPYIPDPVPEVTREIIKWVYPNSPVAVGKTYTGYLQRIEAVGSWSANPETGLSEYSLGTPYVADQIPISFTVTQEMYNDYLEGVSPTLPAPDVYSAQGSMDLYTGWGYVILESVTPNATA